jgi:hypothetical protein
MGWVGRTGVTGANWTAAKWGPGRQPALKSSKRRGRRVVLIGSPAMLPSHLFIFLSMHVSITDVSHW